MSEIDRKKYRYPNPQNQARYLWPEEIERIYRCQTGERYEKRNIAICKIGYCTGMRVSELALLEVGNCFDENVTLLKHYGLKPHQTKGGYGARAFFLSKSAKKALIEYMEERMKRANALGIQITPSSPLFVSQRAKYREARFSENALANFIKYMFLKAGVKNDSTGRASSHSFRRTFATEFSKKYSNPKVTQVLLGHSTIHMTMRYQATNVLNLDEMVGSVFK
jgi:integrase/recombinase XerD